jgi:predicted DNA-binding protein
MRTTIEMQDEHRAKLLELAAKRGEKGFSRLVGEAIEAYLNALSEDKEKRQRALAMRAFLGEEDLEELRDRVSEIRKEWR